MYKSIKLYFFCQGLKGFASSELKRSVLTLANGNLSRWNCTLFRVDQPALLLFEKVPSFEFISSHNAHTITIASNATIHLCVNEKRAGDID